VRLHLNKDAFNEIVSAVVAEYGLKDFQVEKDYYVSLLLEKMVKKSSNIILVFKGGTSLSKCYGIIDRFSEDIDLAVMFNSNRVSDSNRIKLKTIIINTIFDLNMKLNNPDDVRSRRDYNEYK